MVSGTGRKAGAAAGVLAAAVCGVGVITRADAGPTARAAQAEGGLALAGVNGAVVVDQTAQAGAARTFRVANNSAAELTVTAKARPWKQSASGVVGANRRATLAGVRVSEAAFTLEPGASKDITVTLSSVPAAGYLFGALEVVGLPADLSKRKGIVTGYRLLSSLRYNAATPRYSLKAGAAKVVGKGRARTLTLSVGNTGNTAAPVTGTVRLKSSLGTKNSSVKSTRILPGKSVALGLASGASLRAGSYTATVTLIQNKQRTTLTKRIRVR